jgi:hypothetical protein
MEDTQVVYIQEDGIRGLNVQLCMERGKEEDINLVETIIKLQKDVSSDKVDNERLMKAKEQ